MAYDTDLERRIDAALRLYPGKIRAKMQKKAMFGGLAYLYSGKMTVGIVKQELMVRIISGKMEEVLEKSFVRPMDFTNRPMKEFVFVSPKGFEDETRLSGWITLGLEHANRALEQS